MIDIAFPAVLAGANAVVAVLNARVYGDTGKTCDLAVTVAWFGSTIYWLIRLVVEVAK